MMKTHCFIAGALYAANAFAQTPNNFSVQSSAPLTVYGQPSTLNIFAGQLVDQSSVLEPPSIILNSSATGNFVAFMIDPTTSAGPFLHWFQPNMVIDPSNDTLVVDVTTQDASTGIGATYIYPQPPADGYAHQYVILVYAQPDNWAVPSEYSTINPPGDDEARLGFDMADFQSAADLDDPYGTTYFRVINGTEAQTSSASASGTASASGGTASASASATSITGSASATATADANVAAGLYVNKLGTSAWLGLLGLPMLLL